MSVQRVCIEFQFGKMKRVLERGGYCMGVVTVWGWLLSRGGEGWLLYRGGEFDRTSRGYRLKCALRWINGSAESI